MKKFYPLVSILFLFSLGVLAQAPEKFTYQAIIRDASDVVSANQSIGLQISILQGSASGTAVYVETQNPTTNSNGLISIEIGAGSVVSGDFATINWGADLFFIKTEIDITGGTNYTISGTSQLLSVPYALHSKTSGTATGTATFGDVKSGIQTADHNGWVLLDGRLLTSLTPAQQTRATSLGLTGNLPDARDKYLSYSPTEGSTFGSNSVALSKANLPTDAFTGVTDYVFDNSPTINPGQFGLMRLTIAGENRTTGSTDVPGASVEADLITTPIDHRHNFSFQLNNSQSAIDVRPATLNVRMFIYLGE
ncbi:MAG: hypothetical protein U1C58_08475 [Flavobacteriaceae bacterium]|nr:hypothetical protein [Flavobacteriaceae bacterium]